MIDNPPPRLVYDWLIWSTLPIKLPYNRANRSSRRKSKQNLQWTEATSPNSTPEILNRTDPRSEFVNRPCSMEAAFPVRVAGDFAIGLWDGLVRHRIQRGRAMAGGRQHARFGLRDRERFDHFRRDVSVASQGAAALAVVSDEVLDGCTPVAGIGLFSAGDPALRLSFGRLPSGDLDGGFGGGLL